MIVQGDTATAMTGALASYYRRIPVSHVEAGLRSGDLYAPWPEEVNRKVVGTIADQHFAPTNRAAEALRKENVPPERIHITGNTVVDALLAAKTIVDFGPATGFSLGQHQNPSTETVESSSSLAIAVRISAPGFSASPTRCRPSFSREDVAIVLPVHPNPNVHDVLSARLSGHPRVELITPQEYTDFVSLLSLAYVVLTDLRRRPGRGADFRQAGPSDARDHRAS